MNFAGLIVGTGAGSKYLHTLIDGHPDIYGIPGYCLMYFYPHFQKCLAECQTKSEFLGTLIDRNPAVYDTRKLPGSETLNALGPNSDQYINIGRDKFLSELIKLMEERTLTTRNTLQCLHVAHFNLYGRRIYKSMPNLFLYHVHDVFYLNHFKNDFPDAEIISMTRKPSVNIWRRIKSSNLDANKDKLDQLDYALMATSVLHLQAYYHDKNFKTLRDKNPILVSYEGLMLNGLDELNKLCDNLNITKYADFPFQSFGGISHSLSFYSKHTGKTNSQIKNQAKQLINYKPTLLDKLYICLETEKPLPLVEIALLFIYIITPRKYELKYLLSLLSIARAKEYYSYLLQIIGDFNLLVSYPDNHGFYLFKWSTRSLYLFTSLWLREQLKSNAIKPWMTRKVVEIVYIFYYTLIFPVSLLLSPISLMKRIFYQLDLLMSVLIARLSTK